MRESDFVDERQDRVSESRVAVVGITCLLMTITCSVAALTMCEFVSPSTKKDYSSSVHAALTAGLVTGMPLALVMTASFNSGWFSMRSTIAMIVAIGLIANCGWVVGGVVSIDVNVAEALDPLFASRRAFTPSVPAFREYWAAGAHVGFCVAGLASVVGVAVSRCIVWRGRELSRTRRLPSG